VLKRLVPRPVKQKIKNTLNQRALDATLNEIALLPLGELPPVELLERLQTAWDNEGMAAQTAYLREVARHASQTPGPILECGSGLTTLIIGLLAGRRNIESWTFEHFAEWHKRVSETLARQGITTVNNCLAPLRDYGDFSWYDPPRETLPDRFSVIVCDGPPGSTKGGRYGVVPVLKDKLAPGTIILLDDADREAEADALKRWSELLELSISLHEETRGKYAVITVLGLRDINQ
jgi:hypothetical protein